MFLLFQTELILTMPFNASLSLYSKSISISKWDLGLKLNEKNIFSFYKTFVFLVVNKVFLSAAVPCSMYMLNICLKFKL